MISAPDRYGSAIDLRKALKSVSELLKEEAIELRADDLKDEPEEAYSAALSDDDFHVTVGRDAITNSDDDFHINVSIHSLINKYLIEKNVTHTEIIRALNVERSHGYQILNSRRVPTRGI